MSDFRIDQITNQAGTAGPQIAGITTFSGSSGLVMPSGDTRYRYTKGDENIVNNNIKLNLDAGNINSYPGDGDIWNDISGQGNDGEIKNGVVFYNYNEGYFSFDGKDDFININTSKFPTGNTPFTVNSFIQWKGASSGNNLIFTYGQDGSHQAVILWINNSGYPEYQFGSDTGKVVSNSPAEINKWYNICATYDTTKTRIYVNGILEGTTLYSSANLVTSNGVNGNYGAIGRFISGYSAQVTNPSGYGTFNGNISQVSLYDRALDQEEVLQNFNALRHRYGI